MVSRDANDQYQLQSTQISDGPVGHDSMIDGRSGFASQADAYSAPAAGAATHGFQVSDIAKAAAAASNWDSLQSGMPSASDADTLQIGSHVYTSGMISRYAADPAYARSNIGASYPAYRDVDDVGKAGHIEPSRSSMLPNPCVVGENGLGDVDVTVMAYAQWLSEMKQQATNARYQQKAELDLMRDAISANGGELMDFKRHSSHVVQQLQSQVAELRSKLSDLFTEISQQSRQHSECEQRTNSAISGLQDALNMKQSSMDSGRRSLAEHVDRLQADVSQVTSDLHILQGEAANIRKTVVGSQEQTIMKFGEVDQAMSLLQGHISGVRQELVETKQDWKKGQDLLGQAIGTLSQDLADFQKHMSTIINKLQSDVYHMEEKTRGDQDRMARVEAQLSGLHESVLNTTNEMILLKGDNLESQGASAAQMESSELCEVPICRAGSPKRAEQDDGVGSRSTHMQASSSSNPHPVTSSQGTWSLTRHTSMPGRPGTFPGPTWHSGSGMSIVGSLHVAPPGTGSSLGMTPPTVPPGRPVPGPSGVRRSMTPSPSQVMMPSGVTLAVSRQ